MPRLLLGRLRTLLGEANVKADISRASALAHTKFSNTIFHMRGYAHQETSVDGIARSWPPIRWKKCAFRALWRARFYYSACCLLVLYQAHQYHPLPSFSDECSLIELPRAQRPPIKLARPLEVEGEGPIAVAPFPHWHWEGLAGPHFNDVYIFLGVLTGALPLLFFYKPFYVYAMFRPHWWQ